MNLRPNLMLRGAAVPAAFLIGAIVLGGVLFERQLMQALDDSLRALVEVESVSVFDQDPEPHLHSPDPPLFDGDGTVATSRAVFAADGTRVVAVEPMFRAPARLPLPTLPVEPVLRTRETAAGPIRELIATVESPYGKQYALWVASSTSQIQASVRTYAMTTGVAALMAIVFLFIQQLWLASRLSTRVRNLEGHMARLEEGRLDCRPPPDDGADEIGRLRHSIGQATAKLQSAQHAQERLIADAAHELRTPLATLRTNIDVTLRRERDGPELRRSMEDLREEVDRLSALATSLLELARGRHQAWLMGPCDLAGLLKEVAAGFAAELEAAGSEVAMAVPTAMPAVCDVAAIRQALENLIGNAVKFAPPRSKIEIAAKEEGEVWIVEIHNAGSPIPSSEHEAIFEPFHRLDRQRTGTGLGLTIAREIIERHGGTAVTVPDTAGARFVVRLPFGAMATA